MYFVRYEYKDKETAKACGLTEDYVISEKSIVLNLSILDITSIQHIKLAIKKATEIGMDGSLPPHLSREGDIVTDILTINRL